MSHDFKKLRIWETSITLCKEIYLYSANFPKEEIFGLTSQIRRAASSIPANIAEGCGRSTKKDFSHFISIAHGSANEVLTFLILAKELAYGEAGTNKHLQESYESLGNMISAFNKNLLENPST